MRYSIGVDIGATKILAGIVRQDGYVVERLRRSTPATDGELVVAAVVDVVKHLLESSRKQALPIDGIGVGTAGQIDFVRGRVLSGTPNIRNWENIELGAKLGSQFGVPVWVDNDVNVHLLAEVTLGAAQASENVVMLAFGTGVGGAVLVDGRILHGAWGGAAELGHTTVNFRGPMCNCGSRGCLELYGSGTGIAARMSERLTASGRSVSEVSSHEVFAKAVEGDSLARATIDEMVEAISFACVSLIHTFNPGMVILGGGVVANRRWVVDDVSTRVRKLGMKSLVQSVAFETPTFGPEAGLVGAALQVFINEQATGGNLS
ncbi:ROK family protein [Alicyclobacillus dauci]|uniref:ROK family protein n=1 Tax=Alicyclobacillus dauci TaxID=1475485 RepID=A0ABY6YY77_9BACL|nr:ROK family protein [Alicyclobacillus dauci]WAH35573.1 ROK family protein [Alicyclobacillus dauci]